MSQNLSIVIVGRNDNYGGHFVKNLRQFVANTTALLPEAELILVDWNPQEGSPPLSKMLAWPKGTKGQVITVPNEIHKEIDNPHNLSMLEYMAKNVGIRRSLGEFILCTNPDTLISRELAEEIKQELNHYSYYRANRTDVQSVPYAIYDPEIMRAFAEENKIIKHGKWGSYKGINPVHYSLAFLRRIKRYYTYRTFSVPHENAAGDFLLASAYTWEEVHGYPEIANRAHVDSIMMCEMHINNRRYNPLIGNTAHVFRGSLYHQDHQRRSFHTDKWTDNLKRKIMLNRNPPRRSHGWGLDRTELPMEVMS